MPTTTSFSQNLLCGPEFPSELNFSLHISRTGFIDAVKTVARGLKSAETSKVKGSRGPMFVGTSLLLGHEDGILEAFAVAFADGRCFALRPQHSMPRKPGTGDTLATSLDFGGNISLLAFGAARLAMHIRYGLSWQLQMLEIDDVESFDNNLFTERDRTPSGFVKKLLVKKLLDPEVRAFEIDELWDKNPRHQEGETARFRDLALRAWLTARIADALGPSLLANCKPIDVGCLPMQVFKAFFKLILQIEQLNVEKARLMETEYNYVEREEGHRVVYTVLNERFKNKLRPREKPEVILVDEQFDKHQGRALVTDGRKTKVELERDIADGVQIRAIYSLCSQDSSHSHKHFFLFLTRLLQKQKSIDDPRYGMLRKFYFQTHDRGGTSSSAVSLVHESRSAFPNTLNSSQRDVLEAIICSNSPFIVVQGPPGTGKTSVISVAASNIIGKSGTLFIVASSNMAVKNIAGRLKKDNVPFRLIVSADFYDGWNEQMYEGPLQSNLIVTRNRNREIMQELQVQKTIFKIVPPIYVLVDEASQIKILDFMPIFLKCHRLQKMCFFGDPEQLPSYDQEQVPAIKTVFDLRHLKSSIYFLNTQYRIPEPIARFISSEVYDNKLLTAPNLPVNSHCLTIVDVSPSCEEGSSTSFINHYEASVVTSLVRTYYQESDYAIITPYDAQRKLITDMLKDACLRWDNVHTIDSFQGSESDLIIISLVRSQKPGFLFSTHRSNVMLTRCRKSMVIVTSKHFLRSGMVRDTLLGKLQKYWEDMFGADETWISSHDLEKRMNTAAAFNDRDCQATRAASPRDEVRPFAIDSHDSVRTSALSLLNPNPRPTAFTGLHTGAATAFRALARGPTDPTPPFLGTDGLQLGPHHIDSKHKASPQPEPVRSRPFSIIVSTSQEPAPTFGHASGSNLNAVDVDGWRRGVIHSLQHHPHPSETCTMSNATYASHHYSSTSSIMPTSIEDSSLGFDGPPEKEGDSWESDTAHPRSEDGATPANWANLVPRH